MGGKAFVAVKILDAPGPGGCSCGSPAPGGPGYSLMVHGKCQELEAALEARFPGRTSVEYRDLVEHPAERNTPAGQLLANRTYPPPLVVLDGEVRFSGRIPVLAVIEAVAEILGRKAVRGVAAKATVAVAQAPRMSDEAT